MPTACIVTGSSPSTATAGYYSLKTGLKAAHGDALTFSSAILADDDCKILLNVQECSAAQVAAVLSTLDAKGYTIEICAEEQAQEVEAPAQPAPAAAAPSRRGRRKA